MENISSKQYAGIGAIVLRVNLGHEQYNFLQNNSQFLKILCVHVDFVFSV